MPANAVEIGHLGHSYGDRVALRDLDFSIPSGFLFGLLGPNGGGKTTLIRILCTLLRPTSGQASVAGFDTVSQALDVRKRLGIVFQDVALDNELTVRENLHAHASLYNLNAEYIRTRLKYMIPALGLEGRENERVDRLSGGLRRRVDLVRGLLHSPQVLFLDEPTTGLDPVARRAFWDAVDHIRRREDITLIVATHFMEEADRCDLLAIVDAGVMVAFGSPDDLKSSLGSETLWIETSDAAALSAHVRSYSDVVPRIVGSRLQISHTKAHGLLSKLYDEHADLIISATVRRPNLEDVFMVHAGRGMVERGA